MESQSKSTTLPPWGDWKPLEMQTLGWLKQKVLSLSFKKHVVKVHHCMQSFQGNRTFHTKVLLQTVVWTVIPLRGCINTLLLIMFLMNASMTPCLLNIFRRGLQCQYFVTAKVIAVTLGFPPRERLHGSSLVVWYFKFLGLWTRTCLSLGHWSH